MGQYYRIVNLEASEWFSPSDFDETPKHPHLCPKTMAALGRLLMPSSDPDTPDGSWCTDRILIVGDEEDGEIYVEDKGPINLAALYDESERWTNIAESLGGKPYERDDR
jgi:hypothetical protein